MPVTHFVWDRFSDNVLSEVDDAGVETARYMNEPGQFGNLLSQRRSGTNSFYHFDAQGSTRQLSDEAETVTDSYTYTAFGETVASSGSTSNPFRYNGIVGYYTTPDPECVYVRRRTYQPMSARWLSQDPLGFQDTTNLYLYVSNHPTDATDPSGLYSILCVYSGKGLPDLSKKRDCKAGEGNLTCCHRQMEPGYSGVCETRTLKTVGGKWPKDPHDCGWPMKGVSSRTGLPPRLPYLPDPPPGLGWTRDTILFCFFLCPCLNAHTGSGRHNAITHCRTCIDDCRKEYVSLCGKAPDCVIKADLALKAGYAVCALL